MFPALSASGRTSGTASVTAMSCFETSSEMSEMGLLELPKTWLLDLVQHVASGPDGLASAAALSQTCKPIHDLSESSAVTYRNVFVNNTIDSSEHPAWKWLAKRRGRVSGLVLKVVVSSCGDEVVYNLGGQQGEQPADWEGAWQSLAAVQDLQLTLSFGSLGLAEPDACQWLKQHSYLLVNFSTRVLVDSEELTLNSLSEALAPCKALDLNLTHGSLDDIDISSLVAVNSCLVKLKMDGYFVDNAGFANMRGVTTIACLTKLTWLTLMSYSCTSEELWPSLAALSSLKDLQLSVIAYGDPSPLSALTGLTSLYIDSTDRVVNELNSSFSSLQPLSTMQQLVTLYLISAACSATSLHGLAGLSSLRSVDIHHAVDLLSVEGLPGGVEDLSLSGLRAVENMAGLENLSSLRDLRTDWCGDASLQRLSGLSNLSRLKISGAPGEGSVSLSCLEGIEGLGNCLKSLELSFCTSLCSLSGIEGLSALEHLILEHCGVTSLQPLAGLVAPGLKSILIQGYSGVQGEHLDFPPHIAAVVSINPDLW